MKHSVALNEKQCMGCTTCIKCCPTEAIRVRDRKATILEDRCIDCGRCIHVCPHKAIYSTGDDLERLREFPYCVAIPSPALYGQFHNLDDIDIVLNGLLQIGFHKVWESAKAMEQLLDYMQHVDWVATGHTKPRISSGCPTVLRLIQLRFPKLMDNVACTILPMEWAAIQARQEAVRETGLPPEKIGVFSIVPCSSKVTAIRNSEGLQEPVLDGAFAIRDIYRSLLDPMRELKEVQKLSSAGSIGIGSGYCGRESKGYRGKNCMVVDGIPEIIAVLEEIEDDRLPEVDFLELSACTQGCVGGCFNVENPYVARMRLRALIDGMPDSRNDFSAEDAAFASPKRDKELEYQPSLLLDQDRKVAMEKQMRIQMLEAFLPGLHCGSCGAPSCRAFAEDVVMGRASENDCIFKVLAKMRSVAGGGDADAYLPAPFRRHKTDGAENGTDKEMI